MVTGHKVTKTFIQKQVIYIDNMYYFYPTTSIKRTRQMQTIPQEILFRCLDHQKRTSVHSRSTELNAEDPVLHIQCTYTYTVHTNI